jgi:pyruvate/2-oxoacid:ferredoxin oxidoreductase alpha subunit
MCEAMARVPVVYQDVQRAFTQAFGRELAGPLEGEALADARIVIVCLGTTAAAAREAAAVARARGIEVGVVRVRFFRPFPEAELRASLARAERVAVVDRDVAPGSGGVLWTELRALAPAGAIVQGYVAGLGGGDVRCEHLLGIVDDLLTRTTPSAPTFVEVGS